MRCLRWQTSILTRALAMAAALVVGFAGRAGSAQTRLWVATNGDDNWPGTLAAPDGKGNGPKRTFEGARDEIRKLKSGSKLDPKGAVVTVRPGRFKFPNGLVFWSQDGGTSSGRMIWRAEQVGTVFVDGSADVTKWETPANGTDMSKILPSVRNSIRMARLAANGITEVGTLRHNASNWILRPQWADLIFDDQRMTLAKWPNNKPCDMTFIGNNNSNSTPTARFNLTGMRTPSFVRNPNQVDYDHDYWIQSELMGWQFNMFQEKVDYLDRSLGEIRIVIDDGNVWDGARRVQWNPSSPGRMEFVNSLYELDSPGEYYIDRGRQIVFFYPPYSMTGKRASLTMTPGPVVKFDGTSYFDWQGFVVEGGRQDALFANACTSLVVRGNVIRNCGGNGAQIVGGNAVTLRSCEIRNVGEGGVVMSGGNRTTLGRANHLVDNCLIDRIGRFQGFLRPGVKIDGVGMTVRNTEISNLKHSAIMFYGNDNVIERNKIHHVVQDACDSAGIYSGADWTFRGNAIRDNYFYDIDKLRKGYHIVHGIYMDDMFSSVTISGNVFRRVLQPVQIGGGHDNKMLSNIFVDCSGAVRIDDRGLTPDYNDMTHFFEKAGNVPWHTAPWKTKYPELDKMLTNGTYRAPSGNVISGNVSLRGYETQYAAPDFELWGINKNLDPANITFENNVVTQTQQFVDEPNGHFSALPGSLAQAAGFGSITTLGWGVQKDSFIDPAKFGP